MLNKNERDNIGADELEEFRVLARAFLELSAHQIAKLIAGSELAEANNDEGN